MFHVNLMSQSRGPEAEKPTNEPAKAACRRDGELQGRALVVCKQRRFIADVAGAPPPRAAPVGAAARTCRPAQTEAPTPAASGEEV